MSANALQPEKIHITDFKITKGHIESPFEFNNTNVEGHSYTVDLELGFKLDEKLIKADLTISVTTKSIDNTNEDEASGEFCFAFIFYVDNIEELTTTENELVNLNIALGNAISSISYSTSRGILLTRFQGTALSNFILPVINPNDLLK